MAHRKAKIQRKTRETDIELSLDLDGEGKVEASTGIGFLDHMLDHLGKHGLCDLAVRAKADGQLMRNRLFRAVAWRGCRPDDEFALLVLVFHQQHVVQPVTGVDATDEVIAVQLDEHGLGCFGHR